MQTLLAAPTMASRTSTRRKTRVLANQTRASPITMPATRRSLPLRLKSPSEAMVSELISEPTPGAADRVPRPLASRPITSRAYLGIMVR